MAIRISCRNYQGRHERHGRRATVLAVVALALLLIVYGQRWLLQEPPTAANELVVATCMLDAMYGDAAFAACNASSEDKEPDR